MKNTEKRKRAIIIFVYLLVVVTALFLVLRYMQVSSDMSAFLPQGATQTQKILFTQYRQSANSRAVMIGIEGNDSAQLVRINKKISNRLKQSGLFSAVNNGLSSLPKKEANFLFNNRFILSNTSGSENYQVKSLRSHLEQRLEDLSSALAPMIKKTLPRDPAGEFENVLDNWRSNLDIKKVNGIYFSRDNKRSLILAMPKAGATDLNKLQEAIDEINNAYLDVEHARTKLLLSGPVIIALSAREKIRGDVKILSLLATIIVIAFLYLAFGNSQVVLLSAMPLASGMLAGATVVTIFFNSVHGVTIAFGATLIGIAVDYPMHFFSHLNGRKTPVEAISHIWRTLRLSVLTTIIGFSSLLFSGYNGLAQLAVFSISGIIAAILVTRFILPGVLAGKSHFETALPGLQSSIKNLAVKAGVLWPVLVILLVVSVFIQIDRSNIFRGTENMIWNDNLQALSPASEQQLSLDKKLRDDLNLRYSNDLIMITGETQETVLQSSEELVKELDKLVEQGVLEGFESISKYLPSKKLQTARQAQLPSGQVLKNNIKQASSGLPFRDDLFAPFYRDINQAKSMALLSIGSFSGTLLHEKLTTLLFESDGKNKNIWVAPLLLYDLKNPESIQSLLKEFSGTYINLSVETKKIMADYRGHGLEVFSFGVLAIVLVLWLGLGSLRMAMGILVIPFSALLVDSATLSLLGIGLTMFHLVAMLLVAGLGIDYALFFNRIRSNAKEWDTTFPAIWKSWLTTVLVFGSLMISDTAVLKALGQTVTLGVTLSFLFGLIWSRRFSSVAVSR
ncbi:MAG: MMPL family transporter [Acidiferrobacterales bacterium]